MAPTVVQLPQWTREDESKAEVENDEGASSRRRFRDNSTLKVDVLPQASTGDDFDARSGSLDADSLESKTDSYLGDDGLGLFPSGSGNGIGGGRKGRQGNEKQPDVPTPPPAQTNASSPPSPHSSAFASSPPSISSVDDIPENPETPEATLTVHMPRTTLTAALSESTYIKYSPQVTEAPQPTGSTTSRSVLSLTPAFTTPDAALSSEAPKEPSPFPSEAPDATFTTSTPILSQTTSAPESIGTAIQDGAKDVRLPGMRSSGDKALIASGSVIGALILLTLAWIVWRSSDRASARRYSIWQAGFFSRDVFQGPRGVFRSIANKVPFCKSRSANVRDWANLDDPYLDDFFINEKHAGVEAWMEKPQLQEHVTINPYGIILRTPINRDSMPDLLAPTMLAPPLPQAQMNNGFTSLQQPSTPARLDNRLSDLSSLSSGFGDGDIVMPPAAVVTNARSSSGSITDDQYLRNRFTIGTEASEDSPPRFRTVSSWVREQIRRAKRAEQRERDAAADGNGDRELPVLLLPPELAYMMMPDGEEPRRVDARTRDSGSAGRDEVTK